VAPTSINSLIGGQLRAANHIAPRGGRPASLTFPSMSNGIREGTLRRGDLGSVIGDELGIGGGG
jgi:hypothetical protein